MPTTDSRYTLLFISWFKWKSETIIICAVSSHVARPCSATMLICNRIQPCISILRLQIRNSKIQQSNTKLNDSSGRLILNLHKDDWHLSSLPWILEELPIELLNLLRVNRLFSGTWFSASLDLYFYYSWAWRCSVGIHRHYEKCHNPPP